MHAGDAAGLERARRVGALHAGDEHAGGPMRELFAQQLFFLARVVVRDADQRLESGLTQRALRGFSRSTNSALVSIGIRSATCAMPRRQRACSRVGDVQPSCLGSRAHAFNQIRVDGASARQGARDRDRADVGGARGNVGQRDAGRSHAGGEGFLAHVVRMESKRMHENERKDD